MTQPDQTALFNQYQIIESTAAQYINNAEVIVTGKDIPDNAVELMEARTLSWANQYGHQASNEYLKYMAVAMLRSAQNWLEREIELSLNSEWQSTHQMLWDGVQSAFNNPPKGHPLAALNETYQFAKLRVEQSTYEAKNTSFTLDLDQNNLDKALGLESPEGLSVDQGLLWLSHRIILSSNAEEATQSLKEFQSAFSGNITFQLKPFHPKSVRDFRKNGIAALHQLLIEKMQPLAERPEPTPVTPDTDLPEEVFSVLAGSGVVGDVYVKGNDAVTSTPDAIIETLSQKHGIQIQEYEQWKETKDRSQPTIVKKMNYTSIHQSIGRAQYVLLGATQGDDIRIELKNQSVSGSAGNKLPTTIFSLHKANMFAPYKEVFVGVANTTYFSEHTLEFAELTANMFPKVSFHKGQQVLDALNTMFKQRVLELQAPSTQVNNGSAASYTSQRQVADLLGIDVVVIPTTPVESGALAGIPRTMPPSPAPAPAPAPTQDIGDDAFGL